MKPVVFKRALPRALRLLNPGAPLWQRVPTRDDDGRPLTDFMMLVPRLREQSQHQIENTLRDIQSVLEQCRDVVFADFNLAINVLWVSLKCRPGITLEVAAAIRARVPQAVLVAHKPVY
jgi:hypothetical protein